MENEVAKIRQMTEGVIEEMGYELYHLEFVTEEGEDYLRYTIENKNGDEVTLDDCEKVSRRVSEVVDEADPIETAYFLEVSSPGIFKPLFTQSQRLQHLSEPVELRLFEEVPGKKHWLGILKDSTNEMITIETDKKTAQIKVSDIKSLTLNPDL